MKTSKTTEPPWEVVVKSKTVIIRQAQKPFTRVVETTSLDIANAELIVLSVNSYWRIINSVNKERIHFNI